MIHIPLPKSNPLPSINPMLPENVLYGKSPIYLNGSTFDILSIHPGKNGSGITIPINTSANILYALVIPLESKVNIVIICTINDNEVTNKHEKDNDKMNNIKLPNVGGKLILYGYGNNKLIIRIGTHLNNAATSLSDNILI